MDKIFTRWTLLILAFIVGIVSVAWLLRNKVTKTEIRAWVTPKEVELGNPIRFIDSTLNAKDVVWECRGRSNSRTGS